MTIFGITAVRLDRDGSVEAAEIGEIIGTGPDSVLGNVGERVAADIAAMINSGAAVYCIVGKPSERGPQFVAADLEHGRVGIKLVGAQPNHGLQQLIQLESPAEGPNNPSGSW